MGEEPANPLVCVIHFRDMQAERNALTRYCFPLARQYFARDGLGFTEIDLRWGLPVAESEARIVEMCIHELKRCHGYFVLHPWQPIRLLPRERSIAGILQAPNRRESRKSYGVGSPAGGT